MLCLALWGMQIKAVEQFDELDLLGGWELVSYSGTYEMFTKPLAGRIPASECKYLYFGNVYAEEDEEVIVSFPGMDAPGYCLGASINGLVYNKESITYDETETGYDEDEYEGYLEMSDFFISNVNKLHLQFFGGYGGSMQLMIETLTNTELCLKSYDGKFVVKYKRISGPLGLSEISSSSSTEDIYNIKGIKTHTPSRGVNIIRKGGKVSKVAH